MRSRNLLVDDDRSKRERISPDSYFGTKDGKVYQVQNIIRGDPMNIDDIFICGRQYQSLDAPYLLKRTGLDGAVEEMEDFHPGKIGIYKLNRLGRDLFFIRLKNLKCKYVVHEFNGCFYGYPLITL